MCKKSLALLFAILAITMVALPAQEDSTARQGPEDRKTERPEDTSIASIVERSRDSVVTVTHSGRGGRRGGLGTGFVVSADGLIASTLPLIGEARPIEVEFADGTIRPVTEIHAWDRKRDLAIIRVAANNLKPLPLGDSDALVQGEEVIALGNPQGLKYSVVQGVISALRGLEGEEGNALIQVAIPIEPGNSGGPLLDRAGRVQGIITFRSAVSENLGFAMPVNEIDRLLDKPNPVPMARWTSIGALDPARWIPTMGARWSQAAGVITSSDYGSGFGGRTLCIYQAERPEPPYEVAVDVRLDDESGAAGLIFGSDGGHVHYGFYPSEGNLRFTAFEGPDVYSWTIIEQISSEHYKPGEWNHLRVRVEPDRILCFLNGEKVAESADNRIRGGRVGLCRFREPNAQFRSFQLGKDLSLPPVDPELLREIQDHIMTFSESAPGNGDKTAALFESFLQSSSTSRRLLLERADALEETATRLRGLATEVHTRKTGIEIRESLSGPEEDIDLFYAGLLVAKIANPHLDVDAYRDQIDHMASEIAAGLPPDAKAKARIDALNQYLFEENGFHGSRDDYYSHSNSHLNEVLDDHEGIPITLSILYIELARRIGLDNLVGISLPGHFLVQHLPTKGPRPYIDVFDRGTFLERSEAEAMVLEYTGEEARPEHFEPANKKDIILRMLRNLIGIQLQSGSPQDALANLDVYLEVDPDSAGHRLNRGLLRFGAGDRSGAREDIGWLLEHRPEGIRLDRLEELYGQLEVE